MSTFRTWPRSPGACSRTSIPVADLAFVDGPINQLNHGADQALWGSKVCIDGTRKWREEGYTREWPEPCRMRRGRPCSHRRDVARARVAGARRACTPFGRPVPRRPNASCGRGGRGAQDGRQRASGRARAAREGAIVTGAPNPPISLIAAVTKRRTARRRRGCSSASPRRTMC